jgi:hypothetical protein
MRGVVARAHTGGPAVTFAASPTTGALKPAITAPASLAIEFDVRAGGADAKASTIAAVTGGLRLRAGVGRTGPGLGYLGGLDLRAGYRDGGHYELDGHAGRRGAAVDRRRAGRDHRRRRRGRGARRSARSTRRSSWRWSCRSGPTRLLARAGLAWHLTDVDADADAEPVTGLADQAQAFLGLRLGRDRRYWSSGARWRRALRRLTYQASGEATGYGVAIGAPALGRPLEHALRSDRGLSVVLVHRRPDAETDHGLDRVGRARQERVDHRSACAVGKSARTQPATSLSPALPLGRPPSAVPGWGRACRRRSGSGRSRCRRTAR